MRHNSFSFNENNVYYCDNCRKIYNACYELDGCCMCRSCFGDIKIIPEEKVKAFIRKMRLKHLKEISDERY